MKFHLEGHLPEDGAVYVFGTNSLGMHTVGAARVARNLFGAVNGICEGPTGNAYAIPVRAKNLCNLPREIVAQAVGRFIFHAMSHPETQFFVTKVSGSVSGLSDEAAALMFSKAPCNCSLSRDWFPYLEKAGAL